MKPLIEPPYLLFLGDARDPIDVKTARGIHQWRPERCLGQLRLSPRATSLGLTEMSPAEAAAQGARTMVLGTVNAGGFLPEAWLDALIAGARAGLDVASGMHQRLTAIAPLREAAAEAGIRLIDVREPGPTLSVGTGLRRPGRRTLTVGTDCSVGKMYTALALERELSARGLEVSFRATGQTGILIAGSGVPIDAVVADFISGAIEELSPAAPGEWHVIEGQGSLHHPAYAGVTLGLIHGAQPDDVVVCHDPARAHMRHLPDRPLPSLERAVSAALEAAALTNPEVSCLGFSLNTSDLGAAEAERVLGEVSERFGLPAVDPVRTGVAALADAAVEGAASRILPVGDPA